MSGDGSNALERAVGIVLAGSIWVTSAPARAETPAAQSAPTKSIEDTIRRTADPCLSGMEQSVRKWLERDQVDARVTVVIEGHAGEEIVVVIHREGVVVGERRMLTGGLSCERVKETVSLTVAMAIDAILLELRSAEASDDPVPPPAPSEPAPDASSRLRETSHATSRRTPSGQTLRTKLAPSPPVRFGMGLEERVWIEVLPRVAVGLGPFISVERGALRARLAASFTFPVDISFTAPVGTGARVSLVVGEADACALARTRAIAVGPCARIGVGAWSGSGRGFPRADSTTIPWAFVAGALAGTWKFAPRWQLDVHAGLLHAVVRPALTVGRADGRFEQTVVAPGIGASFGLGSTYAF